MRNESEVVELNSGGAIRIGFIPYPEWGEYFEATEDRCDRCWENYRRFTKRKKMFTDRYLCRECEYKSTASQPSWKVFKKKWTLKAKRILWNMTHEYKIPNNPGHS